jgi:hypothetical protein
MAALDLFGGHVIRCLGMYQPFGSLMLNGKVFETRWVKKDKKAPYPLGTYLFYITERSTSSAELLDISGEYQMTRITKALMAEPTYSLRRHAIAIGELVRVRPMTIADEDKAFVKFYFSINSTLWVLEFENLQRIEPFKWSYGKQGIGIIGRGKIPASERDKIKIVNPKFASHLDQFTKHQDLIRCPCCGLEQLADVIHTEPWETRVHNCVKCGYVIMESEWNIVARITTKQHHA